MRSLALPLTAALIFAACESVPAKPLAGRGDATRVDTRQIVPTGLTLAGEDTAPTVTLSLDDARAARDAARSDDARGLQPGTRAWFFRAFDARHLEFLDCRYAPVRDPRPMLRAARYEVVRRVVVERSQRALDAFGVRDQIAQYEQGICGIRVGMPASLVHERLGRPTAASYPQAAGCVDESYGELRVELCQGVVSSVQRGACPR